MSDFKYITFRKNGSFLEFLIFPTTMQHSDFSHYNPVSAGLVRLSINEEGRPQYECYGDSFSLGIKSRPIEDSHLMNKEW